MLYTTVQKHVVLHEIQNVLWRNVPRLPASLSTRSKMLGRYRAGFISCTWSEMPSVSVRCYLKSFISRMPSFFPRRIVSESAAGWRRCDAFDPDYGGCLIHWSAGVVDNRTAKRLGSTKRPRRPRPLATLLVSRQLHSPSKAAATRVGLCHLAAALGILRSLSVVALSFCEREDQNVAKTLNRIFFLALHLQIIELFYSRKNWKGVKKFKVTIILQRNEMHTVIHKCDVFVKILSNVSAIFKFL